MSSLALVILLVPLVNELHGYSVERPADWDAKQTEYADPDAMFEPGGETSFTLAPKDAPNWNAVWFNQSGQRPATRPTILVYAHLKKPLSFEEHTKKLERQLTMLRTKITSAKKLKIAGQEAYEYVYGEGPAKTKLVVRYNGGKRYVLMYSGFGEPYEKFLAEFDAFVQGFRARGQL